MLLKQRLASQKIKSKLVLHDLKKIIAGLSFKFSKHFKKQIYILNYHLGSLKSLDTKDKFTFMRINNFKFANLNMFTN